jgi:hypothetical protein
MMNGFKRIDEAVSGLQVRGAKELTPLEPVGGRQLSSSTTTRKPYRKQPVRMQARTSGSRTWGYRCNRRFHTDEPAVPASWPTRQRSPMPSGTGRSRSLVRGTQESDWTASLAPAETEVRAGTVLPSSGGPEHRVTRALPQPSDNSRSASDLLAELREELRQAHTRSLDVLLKHFLNTHAVNNT